MEIAEEENKRIHRHYILEFYGPMIYMALYIMLLMRATSITRASGRGLRSGNRDYLGPYEIASSRNGECHLGPKKVKISGALPPPTSPSNEFPHIKSIT
jgi:hypothetical protein